VPRHEHTSKVLSMARVLMGSVFSVLPAHPVFIC